MKALLLLPLIIFISFLFFANFAEAADVVLDPTGPESFEELIKAIIKIIRDVFIPLTGVMVIIAGILFATSAGIPERIQQAKNFLIYAIVGLVIVLIAQAVVETMEGFFK